MPCNKACSWEEKGFDGAIEDVHFHKKCKWSAMNLHREVLKFLLTFKNLDLIFLKLEDIFKSNKRYI